MDILKAEIARKRKLIEDKSLIDDNKKFFKRSDLARMEQEDYFIRCGYKNDNKEEDEPSTSVKPVLTQELTEEKLPMSLSRQEVIRRLRERGEPIRMFAESDYDAFQRLRKIEIQTPEVNKGLRNDLKAAMDKIDAQYLNEIVGGTEPGEVDTQHDLKVHEENTTIEELEVTLGRTLGKGDDNGDQDVIDKFLRFLLGVWAKDLNRREDHVKRSVQGKLASATHSQTESYLKPLFRKLRKKNLPADIKESITDIIKFMLEREYVKANDAYLQMAIGNAPWPIGVTMVGIHARTGREKIFSKHVAHVLNDETQRKYIQGLKRLMTICQKHFTTVPSKCVEYNAL
ncbi:pre-mRNA-splicing factor 18 isoform X3 [Notothenia coriiceps]|uniref:Pre-mRNA-splicing factor 18 n=1 Tax=Notothenia coriiceps TaxID=8208 RepID=A0A6I9MJV2_9TELE|nr:PREDICTED: pre-mRNA-splicing factor 18 isoform X3 [Notothenia coriiceps]